MTLQEQLNQQRQAVAEFENAIEDIKNPPKYQPAPSEPLAFLQQQMAQATDKADRAARLAQAEEALKRSKQILTDLEKQWAEKNAQADKAHEALQNVSEEFNQLSLQLQQKFAQLQSVARESESILRETDRIDGAILRNPGAIESFPLCRVFGGGSIRFTSTAEVQREEAVANLRTPQQQAAA